MFTSHDEILTGNSRGMIKLWDVRTNSAKPVHSSSLAEDSEVITMQIAYRLLYYKMLFLVLFIIGRCIEYGQTPIPRARDRHWKL